MKKPAAGAMPQEEPLVKLAKEGRTGFNSSQNDLVQRCVDGVVLIHNHPASSRPSITDFITTAKENAVRGSIVVGHDGSVWHFAANNPSIAHDAERLYNESKQSFGTRGDSVALDKLLQLNKSHNLFIWRRLR